MDIGLYKHARVIRHKTAMPFYPRPPPAVSSAAPAQAGATATAWPLTLAPPPRAVTVTVDVDGGNGMYSGGPGGDADIDHRATMYISRVQERLRRERMMNDDRRMYH